MSGNEKLAAFFVEFIESTMGANSFTVNRVLAIALVIVWLVPIAALFQLPKERAVALSQAIGMLLKQTEQSAQLASQHVRPEVADGLLRDRGAAAALASEPQLLERSLWSRWVVELVAVMVGLMGTWALWFRRRYWKPLALLGVAAFSAVVGLHIMAKLLWIVAGSWELMLKVLTLYSSKPSTILTHLFGPLLVILCVMYVLLSRGAEVRS